MRRRGRAGVRVGVALGAALLGVLALAAAPDAAAQERPVGREAVQALEYPPLDFRPPEPEIRTLPGGTRVLFLEDASLPLVTLHARFEGGYGRFPREYYAAGMSLPSLIRNGGTRTLPPDSVDQLLEFHALQTSFGTGGGSVTSSMNTLTVTLEAALALWAEMLREPRFDEARIEVWRGQEMESVLRRQDDPGRLAVSEFNHLMYGDHPVGWEMSEEDLSRERMTPDRYRWLHRRIVCPDNLLLGVAGDVSWSEIEPLLVRLLGGWPPCEEPLPPLPRSEIRQGGGVFLLPRPLEQSTIVLAHASDVRQDDSADFFASRIGNAILGAGGFSSRLMSRVRTEAGLAYSVGSLWTTPRENRGIVGVITQTRSGATVAATRMILDILEEMRREPPTPEEVDTAVDEAVNGYVFNFESPSQIVLRQMGLEAEGLPPDWLQGYLAGIQGVTPDAVRSVFERAVRPEEMTILIVGDPDAFDAPPGTLGPVTVLRR